MEICVLHKMQHAKRNIPQIPVNHAQIPRKFKEYEASHRSAHVRTIVTGGG